MKKIFAVLMSLVLGGSLCACGNGVQTLGENTGKESSGSFVSEEQAVAGGIMKKQSTQEQSSKGQAVEGLQILNDSDHLANCYTKDGYYYLTKDATELEDGTWGTHLMYMDFPIQFMISGPDPAVLKSLCAQVEGIMRADSSVMLVTNNWGPETPAMRVDYQQQTARDVNLSREDVGLAVLAGTRGSAAGGVSYPCRW